MTSIILKNSNVAEKRPNPANLVDGEVALNLNAASPGVFFKNSNGGLVKAGPTAISATAPNATPPSGGFAGNTTGELWYDSSVGILKIYSGSAWVPTYVTSDLTGLTTGSVTSLGQGANTSAQPNVAIGVNAGITNGPNGASVNIGYNAKAGGSNSVVIGYGACESGSGNSTNNVIVGHQAGSNLTGGQCTVVGKQAGQKLQSQAVAIGYQALQNAVGTNTAVGVSSLRACTTGSSNCAMGISSLGGITTGSNNTAFGESAGERLTGAASNNTIFGASAGPSGASNSNICIGTLAGSEITGSNNILIGSQLSSTKLGSSCSGATVIGTPSSTISGATNNLILCNGNGDICLRFNENGALQINGSYGGNGAYLISQGSGAPPKWSVGATGSFVDHTGQTVTVENGVITSVTPG